MRTLNAHPENLYFPMPPARIDRNMKQTPFLPAVAAVYLTEIQRWRDAVVAAIAGNDPAIAQVENLTPRARARMLVLLDTQWERGAGSWSSALAYGLTPFPAITPAAERDHPMQAVMEALSWRAAVITYLTDVWDVLGKPELTMGECMAIGSFMRPVRLEGRCVYCLSEFGLDRLDPEDHGCVMVRHATAS